MRKLRFLLTLAITCSLTGCMDKFHVIDDYYVYPPADGFGEGYHMSCKLACESDKQINYIRSIYWNEYLMVIEQQQSASNNKIGWYIIQPKKGMKLSCCNGNKTLGPLSKDEMMRKLGGFSFNGLKEKVFVE